MVQGQPEISLGHRLKLFALGGMSGMVATCFVSKPIIIKSPKSRHNKIANLKLFYIIGSTNRHDQSQNLDFSR